MKIDIEHFGPIEKFSYDLDKDLIVTYGNNNIGKSYAMQAVYLLLKSLIGCSNAINRGNEILMQDYIEQMFSVNENRNVLKEEYDDVLRVGKKDCTPIVVSAVFSLLGAMFLPEFLDSCKNTFGNWKKICSDQTVIRWKDEKAEFEIDFMNESIEGRMKMPALRFKRNQNGFIGRELDNISITDGVALVGISFDFNSMPRFIGKYACAQVKQWLYQLTKKYKQVFFLPASRSGIYNGMNAFSSIVAELSKKRTFFTKKMEFPKISEPISDYFLALSNIGMEENKVLKGYYSDIENNILKGKVIFDYSKNTLLYEPDNISANFEMSEVSSMVSEISPIVAFLKYVLKNQNDKDSTEKAILFIEEPEAHLHPNNQIQLMEIFANLIKANVKLIMSSHSNYVFNKLNNLVLGKKLDYNVYQPIILEEHDNGSISKVLPIDELGADDENFVDVSEKLYNEREEIIEQLNMED